MTLFPQLTGINFMLALENIRKLYVNRKAVFLPEAVPWAGTVPESDLVSLAVSSFWLPLSLAQITGYYSVWGSWVMEKQVSETPHTPGARSFLCLFAASLLRAY